MLKHLALARLGQSLYPAWGRAAGCVSLALPLRARGVPATRIRQHVPRPDRDSVPAVRAPGASTLPRPSAVGAAAAAGHHVGRAKALSQVSIETQASG